MDPRISQAMKQLMANLAKQDELAVREDIRTIDSIFSKSELFAMIENYCSDGEETLRRISTVTAGGYKYFSNNRPEILEGWLLSTLQHIRRQDTWMISAGISLKNAQNDFERLLLPAIEFVNMTETTDTEKAILMYRERIDSMWVFQDEIIELVNKYMSKIGED